MLFTGVAQTYALCKRAQDGHISFLYHHALWVRGLFDRTSEEMQDSLADVVYPTLS